MAVRFYVAHGASGSSASMRAHVEGLKRRGIDAIAIDLPVKTAEDVVPRFRTIVPDAPPPAGPAIAVGGQSYGGRVATLAAAGRRHGVRRDRLLQLPAPPARQAGAGRGPVEALAGDPLPGPAALRRGRSVRPDRAAPGRRPAAARRRAPHVSEARSLAEAGPRGRARPRRRVPREPAADRPAHRDALDKPYLTDPRRRGDTEACRSGRTEDARRRAQSGLFRLTLRAAIGSPSRAFPLSFGTLTVPSGQEGAPLPDVAGRRRAVFVALSIAAIVLSVIPFAARSATAPPGINRFLYALGQVESGGNYTARNSSSGAYGKYQIMPSNWPAGRSSMSAARAPRGRRSTRRRSPAARSRPCGTGSTRGRTSPTGG